MSSSGASHGGGAGVTTFNTRAGAVVLSKADVTGTGLAAGDVAAIAASAAGAANGVATLDGTGNVPAGQLGNAAAISHAQGHLAADVPLTANVFTDVLATAVLAVGTWLVTFGATVVQGGSVGECLSRVVVGSATASFEGQVSSQVSGANATEAPTLTCVVTVTVAGTIKLQISSGGSASTAKAATPNAGTANATGYTAVKIA